MASIGTIYSLINAKYREDLGEDGAPVSFHFDTMLAAGNLRLAWNCAISCGGRTIGAVRHSVNPETPEEALAEAYKLFVAAHRRDDWDWEEGLIADWRIWEGYLRDAYHGSVPI